MKRLIKKEHRDELKKLLPEISNAKCNCQREAHWEMLRTAMFSPYKDEETGAVRFGFEEVARAYNAVPDGNFKAGEKIRHFISLLPEGTAELLLVDGKEWCKSQYEFSEEADKYLKVGEGLQRRVLFNWPKEVKEIINAELVDKTPSKDKVYISNGNKRNMDRERVAMKDKIDECLSAVDILESPAAMYMASYLNSLPTNSFSALLNNSQDALNEISNIKSDVVREQQLKILNAILESPKPIYRPSKNGNTDRLFGNGPNLTNLKKEVRRALTKDWVEFDLQSSQLAIVAKLWDIKPLKDFLSEGKSIWDEFFTYFEIATANEEVKKAVKKSLKERIYGLVYGESRDRIVNGKTVNDKVEDEGLTSQLAKFGIKEGGLRFVNHPLMKQVLRARQQYMKTLLEMGSVEDAYGTTHIVNRDNILSIMSRIAQSYEQILIYGVFELTNDNFNEWTITLLQHDGVSIKFHNDSRKEYWINKICTYINDRCKDFDIPSSLIVDDVKAEMAQVNENFRLLNEMKAQKQVELEDIIEASSIPEKETPGIYVIYCQANRKAYFGKSTCVLSRLNTHKSALLRGAHDNKRLQRAFNKYGSESFVGCMLQQVEVDDLTAAEAFYINYFNSVKQGFNRKREGIN